MPAALFDPEEDEDIIPPAPAERAIGRKAGVGARFGDRAGGTNEMP